MTADLVPFTSALLAEAAGLLARRQRRDRQRHAALPERFAGETAALAAVEAVWRQRHSAGVAAVQGGRLAAYLIGEQVIDPVWGRSGWVRPAGWAAAADQPIEILRDLYAALGAEWVAAGCFFHFAVVHSGDAGLVDRWFSLSFGLEQVYGLCDLSRDRPLVESDPPGLEIRRAAGEDAPFLAGFSDLIWRHQVREPVWGLQLPEEEAAVGESWSRLAGDPTRMIWLAFLDGEPVGFQGYWPAEPAADDLLLPDRCLSLGIAGTVPARRGQGIGRALTTHGLSHARAAGYAWVEADWRSTNLTASRFWPRLGFEPVAYRLVRRVDPRIAWGQRREEGPRRPVGRPSASRSTTD